MNEELSKNDERWLILRARLAEENIKRAFEYLRRHGVEPVLIKGWAAARLYPLKHRRPFADIDLAVAPERYETTRKLLDNEFAGSLNIDLHRGLRHLDTLDWETLFAATRTVDLDGVPIRLLAEEDHLRVLCVHWLNDGGADRDKLQDIRYAVARRDPSFDWERCLGAVDANRREWVIRTIALARRYCGLEVEGLDFAPETERLPAWLIRALEKEWASPVRLTPLNTLLWRREEFWRQIKKRIPPNPIQATVEMEGKFDDRPRVFYQLGSVLRRIGPSLKRLLVVAPRRFKRHDR
jgi:hypothetical protein